MASTRSGKLTEIAAAIRETGRPLGTWSLLIYGPPKVGKTELAATIAKVPYIRNVHYWDIENGSETLVTMIKEGRLQQEAAEKITIYQIPDTKQVPMAMDTVMKALTVTRDRSTGQPVDHVICYEHGKISCVDCAKKNVTGNVDSFTGQHFNLANLGPEDVFVLDSGSQFGNSVLNYYLRGKDRDYKPGWDEYGPQNLCLIDAFSVIQRARTNFIVLTHEVSVTREENDVEVDKYYPLIGTKNFSMTCAKYFSHVAYLQMKLGLHAGGSRTDYRKDVITGSRGGWELEQNTKLDLSLMFADLTKERKVIPIK